MANKMANEASECTAVCAASGASGASGFLLGDDAAEFMRQRGEQTWEAANEAGGCTAEWCDECEQCGDAGGLRACCGYCNLVFHPTFLDPPQDAQVVENWDEVAFACGRCVTDAMAKVANTTQGARLKRQMRQRRATTAAAAVAEARRAARDNEIRDEHEAIAMFEEQRAGGAAAGKRAAASASPNPRRAHKRAAGASAGSPTRSVTPSTPHSSDSRHCTACLTSVSLMTGPTPDLSTSSAPARSCPFAFEARMLSRLCTMRYPGRWSLTF